MEDLLGKPGEGIHATRFYGYALYDILGTVGISFLVWYFTSLCKDKTINSFIIVLIGLFILAEILHWIFGVKTAFLKNIGIV